MSKRKPGQWWDKSWSVVTGCSWPPGETPEGCRNCWARSLVRRFPAAHAGDGISFGHVSWHPDRLDIPLRTRKSTTWAVSLMGDLFHPDVPSDFIREVLRFTVMAERPHRYVILTKRWHRAADELRAWDARWPDLEHPWRSSILLASTWDQESTAAACEELHLPMPWGLHIEPLLGPVDMGKTVTNRIGATMPSWIVVGPENGPGKRPCDPRWIESIERQCHAARVPVWRKDNEGPKEVPW